MTDLEAIHHLHSLSETDTYNTLGIPASLEETQTLLAHWINDNTILPRQAYIFCIIHEDTQDFIGLIAVRMGKPNYKLGEVWYKTLPAYWRKGYTSEALHRLLQLCFSDLQLHRIQAGCAVENIASIKVLEKVGMLREGRKRKILPIRGEWVDNYMYAILDEDFKEGSAK